MSTAAVRWGRRAGGLAVLGVVVARVGTGPFRTGLRSIDVGAVVAAVLITAVTTVASAWRWRIVARGLGIDLPLGSAVAAYYRSQFLNATLPLGVLGDVDRAVRSGRTTGDVGRGIRAVVWERTAGQVVQASLASIVLVAVDSPLHKGIPLVVIGVVIGIGTALIAASAVLGDHVPRFVARVRADGRAGLLARSAWPRVVLASTLVVVGHVAVFVVAARGIGSFGLATLLPLALIVLLASAIPLNIAGWGPREGVAAWAFAAAGLGSGVGVATATAFGLLALIGVSPGAVVLLWGRRRAALPTPTRCRLPPCRLPLCDSSTPTVSPRPLVGAVRRG